MRRLFALVTLALAGVTVGAQDVQPTHVDSWVAVVSGRSGIRPRSASLFRLQRPRARTPVI
jgi:hypothetical protein